MKLKYFLRGLGIGIIVTTIILMASYSKQEKPLTDAQIIAKAKKLGMIEAPVSSETPSEEPESTTVPSESSIPSETPTTKPKKSNKPDEMSTSTPKPSETPTPTPKTSETPSPTPNANKNNAEEMNITNQDSTITIEISSGMWSEQVASDLEQKGLIDSAKKFDNYLVEHDYQSKISIGTYEIPIGADYEEIASIITKR